MRRNLLWKKRRFVFNVNRRQAVAEVPEMPEYADKTLLTQTCRMNLPALLSVWQGRWGGCAERENSGADTLDTVVLTLACGKYRFNDLDMGKIGGLPRLMDMGQCNDAYSAIKVASALAEAFKCGVNELPLSMILSWYEQKAVCILLTLLHLVIKNIKLGPTVPAFISPNVLN